MKALSYSWRLLAKIFAFTAFGIGGLVLSILIFPAIRICVHPRRSFRRALRKTVSASFSWFVRLMILLGLIRVRVREPKRLREARGVIVVANHPSLIDVVILIAHLPQADCIIKSRLRKNAFVRGIVESIYIPNSLCFEDLVAACADSLAEGNSLVIFPEGTRTAADSRPSLRRGCAQIAVRVGCGILPVLIRANDPRGLRKGDPFLSLPREGRMEFTIEPLEQIPVAPYLAQEPCKGARELTREIQARIVRSKVTIPPGG